MNDKKLAGLGISKAVFDHVKKDVAMPEDLMQKVIKASAERAQKVEEDLMIKALRTVIGEGFTTREDLDEMVSFNYQPSTGVKQLFINGDLALEIYPVETKIEDSQVMINVRHKEHYNQPEESTSNE